MVAVGKVLASPGIKVPDLRMAKVCFFVTCGHLCDAKVETTSQELVHQNFVVTVVTPNNEQLPEHQHQDLTSSFRSVRFLGIPIPSWTPAPTFHPWRICICQEETRGDARLAL